MDNVNHFSLSIHHTSLLIEDTGVSLNFYRDLLGLSVNPGRPDLGYPGAWLDVGSHQIHLLELPSTHSVDDDLHGGRDYHVAFHVQGLDELKTKLEAESIKYTMSKSGRKALFCRDPDGNALEFIERVG
jgi:glyoxylase I family protein